MSDSEEGSGSDVSLSIFLNNLCYTLVIILEVGCYIYFAYQLQHNAK